MCVNVMDKPALLCFFPHMFHLCCLLPLCEFISIHLLFFSLYSLGLSSGLIMVEFTPKKCMKQLTRELLGFFYVQISCSTKPLEILSVLLIKLTSIQA